MDSEEDREDPSDEDGPPPSKKIKLSSPKTVSLLQAVMEKPLRNERRKKFAACDEAHTPKLDDAIACIVPKSAKTYDRFLSKLQQFSLDALGPMIWLYDQMSSEQGVDATKAKAAVESSITLLGNAATHFSTERRKCLMKHLNKDLRPLCEGKFPNRGAYLFGDNFGSKAKKTADNIRALKGVSFTKERFSRYGSTENNPRAAGISGGKMHNQHKFNLQPPGPIKTSISKQEQSTTAKQEAVDLVRIRQEMEVQSPNGWIQAVTQPPGSPIFLSSGWHWPYTSRVRTSHSGGQNSTLLNPFTGVAY